MRPAIVLNTKAHGPVKLRPTYEVWVELEQRFGNLGALYVQHHSARVNLAVCEELILASAAGVGLTRPEVRAIIEEQGLFAIEGVVGELFGFIFKGADDVPLGQQTPADPAPPLQTGD